MATSRSPDWTGEALVFSGRPNPTWTVQEPVAHRLVSTWSELPARQQSPPSPPPLGYRGSVLRAPDGREWRAFGHAVTLVERDRQDVRADRDRRWERALLDTAPAGALPPLQI